MNIKNIFTLLALILSLAHLNLNAQTTVHVETAGTLSELLNQLTGGSTSKITTLTITGNINGDDFVILKTMSTSENLSTLNLQNATIVYGGDTYYTHNNRVPQAAFANALKLKSIVLPDNIVAIETNAFLSCYNLKDVAIPNSVTFIADYAFEKCFSITNITIPDNVTTIGREIFYGCVDLESAYIGSSLTSTGHGTFNGCSKLTDITFGENITTIGNSSFKNCKSLKSVKIPNNITSIESSAFSGCLSLDSITLPEGITSIELSVFSGCTELTEVILPNSVTLIKPQAFLGCQKLENLNIPKGVTSIEMQTFWGCTSLTSITIPENITNIGENVFGECTSLTQLHILSPTPPQTSSNFYDIYTTCTLYVPQGASEAYKAANYWKLFDNIVEENPMSINQPQNNAINVYANSMNISIQRVEVGTNVEIYTESGVLIKSVKVTDDIINTIEMKNKGIYIIRVKDQSFKVIV